jgi:Family of unknown function (DUF6600)/FecR protein
MLPRLVLTLALAIVLCASAPAAQTPQQPAAQQPLSAVSTQQFDAPAYVSVVDGGATLERDGRVETSPLNMPLLAGDRLRTTDGRVEVRFTDGGRLHLDSSTAVDVLSDELVRLGDGRIRLAIQRAQEVRYRVDSAVGSVRITQPGEYRLAILHTPQETQLEFAVVRGAGEIFTEQGTTAVRSGERAYSSAGLAPSYAYTYNSANMDDFDRWAEMQRGTVYTASSDSSQYLPSDMGGYASTFDQYGDWRYQQTYGYVWYPRVAAGWRPYHYGRWAPYPTYGWTWITGDPFGYPTHHYGRWGFSGSWFWIPSGYWGPAYVSWGYAPSYVSWCPLGWNNLAVFSLGFYNVGPAYYAGHYRGYYYPAWTTVPHTYFGRGYYAHQHAVNWDRPGYTGPRARFTESRTGPNTRDVAVARGTATPIRYGGTGAARADVRDAGNQTAVARESAGRRSEWLPPSAGRSSQTDTPRYINRGDQIVRSQTERPTSPSSSPRAQGVPGGSEGRDIAISRTAPQTAPLPPRERRAGDNLAYRPPANDAPSYDRAVPRTQAAPPPPGAPGGVEGRGYGRPGSATPRVYDRPSAGDRTYAPPYAGDRAYARPGIGDRAYERPTVGDRAYQRPPAGHVEPPRTMERPASPPPATIARPMERFAPPPSAAAPRPSPAAPRPSPAAPPPSPAAPPPAARPMGPAPGVAPPAPAARPGGGGGDRAVPRGGRGM